MADLMSAFVLKTAESLAINADIQRCHIVCADCDAEESGGFGGVAR
jgi:hypothetical protein